MTGRIDEKPLAGMIDHTNLKAVSGDIFRRYIGEDYSLIMSNLKYISENADMYIRVPLIKGVNTERN